ncbi:MAG: iron ABC transporter permease [Bacteroidota bacterium]
MQSPKNRWAWGTPILAIVMLMTLLFSLTQGAYQLSLHNLIDVFLGSGAKENGAVSSSYLLFNIRLPRILLGALVGASLAVSGTAIQGLFRNPLAEPTLIGITSGGMLFAVAGIYFTNTLLAGLSAYLGYTTIAMLSFIGSFLTTVIIYRLASYRGKTYVTTMLLAGIAITALCGAMTGLMIYFSDEAQLRDITFWTLGSLSGGNWKVLYFVIPVEIIAIFFLIRTARSLDIFLLGESEAAYLGVNVQRVKWTVIFFAALAVGTAVSVTGIIGFVALVVPHTLRLLTGTKHFPLLINSALLGATLLVLADTFARTAIAPAELPIGVITALIGAPFFIWMLLRARERNVFL